VTVERLPRDTIDGRSHCLTLTASRPRRCLKRFATGTHVRGRRPVVRRISMLAKSELLEAVGARYRARRDRSDRGSWTSSPR
jgi:hypothetical protein